MPYLSILGGTPDRARRPRRHSPAPRQRPTVSLPQYKYTRPPITSSTCTLDFSPLPSRLLFHSEVCSSTWLLTPCPLRLYGSFHFAALSMRPPSQPDRTHAVLDSFAEQAAFPSVGLCKNQLAQFIFVSFLDGIGY